MLVDEKMILEVSILTLNVWGIPYISHDRKSRMSAIADEISKEKYDVVSLQEVWSEDDYNSIRQKTESIFQYSHYFYSGVIGAGLCILSKHPIILTFFHPWLVNGYFHRIQHGDWFGGKGIALCKILIDGKIVNIYDAHLHAEYDNKNDDYKTHRAIQAFEAAQFIESTRGDSVLQILAGDLNTQPDDICYKTILSVSKMMDCCSDLNAGTNECLRNSYSPSSAVDNPTGIRIDHIFARTGSNYKLNIDECFRPFPDRVPGTKFSYSDHEAVTARIRVIQNDSPTSSNIECFDKNESMETIQGCLELCDLSLKKLKTDKIFYYTLSIVLIFILICVFDYGVPYGFKTLLLCLKFILIALLILCIYLATIWNYTERNAILCGKHSMQVTLKSLKHQYFT